MIILIWNDLVDGYNNDDWIIIYSSFETDQVLGIVLVLFFGFLLFAGFIRLMLVLINHHRYYYLGEKVDIVKAERIQAFCSSDEDDEEWERKQLIFLPCTPDVEEPEESRGGSTGADSPPVGGGGGGAIRDDDDLESSSAQPVKGGSKRKRTKVHQVPLDDPPVDGK